MKRASCLWPILIVVMLLISGCTPAEQPATPTAAPTGTHIPTSTPLPAPTATATPGPDPALIRAYQILSLINETAAGYKMVADSLQTMPTGMFPPDLQLMLMPGISATAIVDAELPATTPPEALQPLWDEALAYFADTKDIGERWLAREIAASQAATELEPIAAGTSAIMQTADEIMAEAGFTPEQLARYRSLAMQGAFEALDEMLTATVVDNSEFELVDHNAFVFETELTGVSDELHVIGLVRNNHAADVYAEVTVALLDAAGNTVITKTTTVELNVIPAGEISPFDVILKSPPQWQSYAITFAGRSESVLHGYTDFEIVSHSAEMGAFDELDIHGQIKNTGNETAMNVMISLALYDAQGKIIGVGLGGVTATAEEGFVPVTAPGETDAFVVGLNDWAGPPSNWASYEFFPFGQ